MSSQMAPAEIANKTIDIKAGDYNLKAGTSKILFDGFLKLYNDARLNVKRLLLSSILPSRLRDIMKLLW